MKKFFGILIITLMFSSSCTKQGLRSDLDDSREAWLDFKIANDNSYAYTVNNASWTGSSSTTNIVVVKGTVTERHYNQYVIEGAAANKKLVKSWVEDGTSLNSHKEGAAAWTLDDVYEKAENEWLKADKAVNDLYFETDNNGMISLCGYVPKGCQDDCLIGVRISEVQALSKGKYLSR